jgi:hypothetical protein
LVRQKREEWGRKGKSRDKGERIDRMTIDFTCRSTGVGTWKKKKKKKIMILLNNTKKNNNNIHSKLKNKKKERRLT